MNLLLKDMDERLVGLAKVAAFRQGQTLRKWFISLLEQAVKDSNEIPHKKRRAMAATREGDAAEKTCEYQPSETSVVGTDPELGQAEAQGPSARHDGVAHRSLARKARTEGLSAPSGKTPKCERHGKVMKDFGNSWLCEGPPQHKEFK